MERSVKKTLTDATNETLNEIAEADSTIEVDDAEMTKNVTDADMTNEGAHVDMLNEVAHDDITIDSARADITINSAHADITNKVSHADMKNEVVYTNNINIVTNTNKTINVANTNKTNKVADIEGSDKVANNEKKNKVASNPGPSEPSSSNSSKLESDDSFQVGDMVWAKIGRYPLWPSIVCVDPDTELHLNKIRKKKAVHVRFCDDDGRRSWSNTIEMYSEEDITLKYPDCLSFIKNNRKEMKSWKSAVKEANELLKYDRETRIKRFYSKYNLDLPMTFVAPANLIDSRHTVNNFPSKDDPKMFNAHVHLEDISQKNKKEVQPKRKYSRKPKKQFEIDTPPKLEKIIEPDEPEEPEIPTTKLERLVPQHRKNAVKKVEEKYQDFRNVAGPSRKK